MLNLISENVDREERDLSFSNLNSNGIVTVNNGIATVMNASGIFVFPVTQLQTENTASNLTNSKFY
jgi:hypothetical protein